MTSFDDIPVLDLRDANLAETLTTICHEVGFVMVTGHGIEPSVVDDVFTMMDRFFSLPEADKRRIDKTDSPYFRGWEPVGTEFTNNRQDVREQIDIWSEWPPIPDATGPDCLLGPNQWMPEEILADQAAISGRWMSELGALSDRLLGQLCIGLGMDEHALRDRFGDQPMSLSKFIHYPPTPEGAAGVNAHKDTGFLTVLAPGPTPGLEVQNPEGEWIAVPTIDDAFVINLGELLQALTGNYLIATAHRVISNAERFSAAYFHGPSLGMPLAGLPLDARFGEAVANSPRHTNAGFMARREETDAGIGDMASPHRAETYGDQLWNYFLRSYPNHPTIA